MVDVLCYVTRCFVEARSVFCEPPRGRVLAVRAPSWGSSTEGVFTFYEFPNYFNYCSFTDNATSVLFYSGDLFGGGET